MQTRKSARLIIVDSTARLLLFRYHDEHQAAFWATPGGELKTGESYRDAASRELYEETGLEAEIGPLLKERDEVYAVARSGPDRWLEKYYLVSCPEHAEVFAAKWTEEEQSTIQEWKWWGVDELLGSNPSSFKPEWLPRLLESVIKKRQVP
ncbi:MAG: hypothetical protein NPIRA05_01490 [Nitrospirales bacterium]|nr:MAG: hypothetical protein NPIRA05_01490 [Nitrospirales bacterium]